MKKPYKEGGYTGSKKALPSNIYKGRWVVKCFEQTYGLDYIETFSTTCRPETYRTIVSIALQN